MIFVIFLTLQYKINRGMQRFRSLLAILLIPVICWLFTNAVINQHSHLLQNGQIITHAHPYTPDKSKSSPFQKHQHSPYALETLAQLSNPLTLVGFVAAILSALLFFVKTNFPRLFADPLVGLSQGIISNRAPPCAA
jgi:hypothetical protein